MRSFLLINFFIVKFFQVFLHTYDAEKQFVAVQNRLETSSWGGGRTPPPSTVDKMKTVTAVERAVFFDMTFLMFSTLN